MVVQLYQLQASSLKMTWLSHCPLSHHYICICAIYVMLSLDFPVPSPQVLEAEKAVEAAAELAAPLQELMASEETSPASTEKPL